MNESLVFGRRWRHPLRDGAQSQGESAIAFSGLREITTGVAILASRDPAPFVWDRVAGDALDLVSLVGGFAGSRRKGTVGLAVAPLRL